ncbi:cysteine proteinase inhibitor 8-like [Panicum miliaceum]|uniref:Cysteine proteinase inhibitor 8-like n=1 Tax=Panicum miliaceum TaxID=4540 RepID=A0A3L6TJ23_PANMI|nr:cysteine proteinase inhibitor 8-like [Panicum miliaceum]
MRPSLLLAPLLLATFLLATTTADAQNYTAPPPPASNWTPVADVNDPTIQQVAQFAVRIYALSTKQLRMQLLGVVSGETQPYDGGYNYRLVVRVSGGKNTQYDAFVWGILGTMSWKLWSFTPTY